MEETSGIIEAIVDALDDGKWHTLNEISTYKNLKQVSLTDLATTLNFLAEYDFIELQQTDIIVKARLDSSTQAFLRKIRWIEREEQHAKPKHIYLRRPPP